jgi:ribosomal protein S6
MDQNKLNEISENNPELKKVVDALASFDGLELVGIKQFTSNDYTYFVLKDFAGNKYLVEELERTVRWQWRVWRILKSEVQSDDSYLSYDETLKQPFLDLSASSLDTLITWWNMCLYLKVVVSPSKWSNRLADEATQTLKKRGVIE